eukprot:1185738-Prorocentrum_minimum.AAC.3
MRLRPLTAVVRFPSAVRVARTLQHPKNCNLRSSSRDPRPPSSIRRLHRWQRVGGVEGDTHARLVLTAGVARFAG